LLDLPLPSLQLLEEQVMRCVAIALVLAVVGGIGRTGEPAVKQLPAELVAEWKKAGAKVGWMSDKVDLYNFHAFAEGKKGELPGFILSVWKSGVVAKLPQPQMAFGLDLWYANVTDVDLKELAALRSLQMLNLDSTKVTDAGLKDLAALNNLQYLNLYGTSVTDAGLKDLAALKTLKALRLEKTQITDAGLKELAALKNLQALCLDSTQLTDAGLKYLAALQSLKELYLGDTKITDAGLKELTRLKNLQSLKLQRTRVTDAGVAELQKALPMLKIVR
jgi:internalin A